MFIHYVVGVGIGLLIGLWGLPVSVFPAQWDTAVQVCSHQGGVAVVKATGDRSYLSVKCKNGVSFNGDIKNLK